MSAPSSQPVFACQMCGQCCEGRGGIVLTAREITRMADFLEIPENQFSAEYCEIMAGKLKLRSGANGFCIFFRNETGCIVHTVKPDVCAAWPFFRGNLVDEISLEMAKAYCPGIRSDATFQQFSARGFVILRQSGLIQPDGQANALKLEQ